VASIRRKFYTHGGLAAGHIEFGYVCLAANTESSSERKDILRRGFDIRLMITLKCQGGPSYDRNRLVARLTSHNRTSGEFGLPTSTERALYVNVAGPCPKSPIPFVSVIA